VSIRVLVADDQSLVRTGLRTILQAEPDIEVVGQAADGAEAVRLAAGLSPDVVLLDIRMPGMDGITATRQILAGDGGTGTADATAPRPVPRVIILTTFDLDEYVYRALRAGAAGFLVKDIPDDQLTDAIRAAMRGDTLLAPSVTRRLIESYTRRPPTIGLTPGADSLTSRETEVWRLMARGMSNAEIAAELFLGEATVKTHVSRVMAKLGARDRIHAVIIAFESGIAQ
jgi:DNA-binding NarL/FixJ family response regulator